MLSALDFLVGALIVVSITLCVLFSRFRFARWFNPISVIVVWWGGWLFLAYFSPVGLDPLSFRVVFFTIIFIVSVVLGALLCRKKARRDFSMGLSPCNNVDIRYRLLIFVCTIFSLPIFYGLFLNFGDMLDPVSYYVKVRGEGGLYRAAFGSERIGYFVTIFSMSAVFCGLVVGSQTYSIKRRFFLYGIAIASLVVYAQVSQERFGLLTILYIAILTSFCSYWDSGRAFINVRSFFIISALIGVMVYLSLIRTGGAPLFEILNKYVIMYHTVGFTILDKSLESKFSILSGDVTFGLLSLGFFERTFFVLTKLFPNELYASPGLEFNREMAEIIRVGFDDSGNPLFANAFTTSLLPSYLDGGVPFIVLIGVAKGYLITRFYVSMVNSKSVNWSVLSRSFFVFFMYASLASIYQGVISNQFFWGSVLLLALCFRRRNSQTDC